MYRIIILVVLHIFADYFIQGNKIVRLKALKISYLLEHVAIYTVLFILLSPLLLGLKPLQALMFSLINGVIHFAIDYKTGKLKLKYLDDAEPDYKYLSTVFVDHALHIIILILTYRYLFPDAINSLYGLTFI
jgi:Protein of unknown function (DUF3307).